MEWLTNIFSSATLKSFNWRDRTAASAWFQDARPWLHPGPGNLLEVDEDAKSFGTVFDSPELFPKTIQMMREEKTKRRPRPRLCSPATPLKALGPARAPTPGKSGGTKMPPTFFTPNWAATSGMSIHSPGSGAFRRNTCAVLRGRTSDNRRS